MQSFNSDTASAQVIGILIHKIMHRKEEERTEARSTLLTINKS